VAGEKWPEHLSLVLLGLRAASKDSDGISLAKLAYSAPLTLPGQILYSAELPKEIFMKQLLKIEPQPTQPLSYAQAAATFPQTLLLVRFVYVRRGGVVPPLLALHEGPYTIFQSGPNFF
jgi:hypothetical protein